MIDSLRPLRSVLYMPASNARAMEKGRDMAVDGIIFDLEDAVAVDEKVNARAAVATALNQGGYGKTMRILRINGLDTAWGHEDARASVEMDCDAVLLPKVERTDQIDALAAIIGDRPIWAMMETPKGMLNASTLAAHPKLKGMVMGTNDLAKDLGIRAVPDRSPLMASLGLCVLAARAEGIPILDGVFNAFKDETGLRAECEQGRDLGFDGKTLIHPAQVAVANAAFAPTEEEIDLARRQIAAFDAATADGQAVAVVDGKIVENLHVATARAILAKADAIDALAAE